MAALRESRADRLHARMCLSCGYQGRELQQRDEASAYSCPFCGADLYARPARSYAEMEGLAPLTSLDCVILDAADSIPSCPRRRAAPRGFIRTLIHRVASRVRRALNLSRA
ncbi:MAG: hypothetical protein AB7G11_12700 [Phycisphaerales bacterium]